MGVVGGTLGVSGGCDVLQPALDASADEVRWQFALSHRARVMLIARGRCSSFQDAEDVVHEVLLNFVTKDDVDWSRAERLLTTMTVRRCADLHRERSRAASHLVRRSGDDRTVVSPCEAVCDADEGVRAVQAAALLRGHERSVLSARAEGLTLAEAAATLGLTYRAAEGAYGRARVKMRRALQTAWLLLGLVWRRLKSTAPVAVAAVTVALSLALVGPDSGNAAAGVSPHPYPASTERGSRVDAEQVRVEHRPVRPDQVVRDKKQPPAAATAPRPPAARVPGGSVGPVRYPSTTVEIDRDEPIEDRVARCVRNGVEVRGVGVVCREDPEK